jgi:uncharacterized membrane protein
MTRGTTLMTAAGVGAGFAWFLDPDRGRRRRARVRDVMAHSAALTADAVGATSRDVLHRTYGTAASLRGLLRREQVDDDVLAERVRARLGRLVSHPHAVQVAASNGIVTLSGPVLRREAARLIRQVHKVHGVRELVDALDVREQAGNTPSLQGGRAPAGSRVDVLQYHWAPATRALIGTAGAALAVAGALRRDGPGRVATLIGVGLIARAATNLPANRLVGIGARRRAVDVQKTITINTPVGEVYAFWSEYENYPRFLSRVLEVKPHERHPRRSHWTVAGPAGVPVNFDAEITRNIPNQIVAWRTLRGSPIAHAGIVRFDSEADGRTRVHIRMSYNPPAGWIGHGVAAAFGADPKSSMDADLVRLKTLIETGHAARDAADRRV